MKKMIFFMSVLMVVFAGCSTHNVGVVDGGNIDRYFHKGYIVEQRKMIVDESLITSIKYIGKGAVVGAGAGAVVGGNTKSTIQGSAIGALVGGIASLLTDSGVPAFETVIDSSGKKYVVYLDRELPKNTALEFTVKENKLKNVSIINPRHHDVYVKDTVIRKKNPHNKNDKVLDYNE